MRVISAPMLLALLLASGSWPGTAAGAPPGPATAVGVAGGKFTPLFGFGKKVKREYLVQPFHVDRVPVTRRQFLEFAKKVTCPVLFVSGGPRGFHPPDEDERLAAFPSVERFTIEDAGHMVHWTKPDELATRLVTFLT